MSFDFDFEIDNVTDYDYVYDSTDDLVDYSNDCLNAYLKEIGSFPRISNEETIKLIKLAQGGDNTAKHKVLNSNLRLVVSLAKKHFSKEIDPLDLIFEGNLGLNRAIDRFDTQRDIKFSTFAGYYIDGKILDFIHKHYNLAKVPKRFYYSLNKVRNFKKKYFDTFGEVPSDEIIMSKCEVNEKLLRAIECFANPTISIDEELNEAEGVTLVETIASDSDEMFEQIFNQESNKVLRKKLKKHISLLTRNERIVLIYTYGLFDKKARDTESLANSLKVTKRCIEQTRYRAQMKLYLSLNSEKDLDIYRQ